ncbi:hypothetical protein [Actinomadura chokoriensis]|uniref:hypothetical protein n=1 Tax=Actinomadura chokoriensis TaxID=454156 RepID=UPI0031F9CFFA
MIGNSPYDRDELLVTGIPPAAEPLVRPPVESPPDPATDTRPLTEAAPVFVDASGWRARLGRRLGLLAGALLVVFLGALGLGMTTGTTVPLTPWSEPSARPHVKVTPPRGTPSRTAEPPSAARPGSSGPAGTPAPSTAPRSSSAPSAGRPSPTAVTSTHPGKSQAEPPAWGRGNKKPR